MTEGMYFLRRLVEFKINFTGSDVTNHLRHSSLLHQFHLWQKKIRSDHFSPMTSRTILSSLIKIAMLKFNLK